MDLDAQTISFVCTVPNGMRDLARRGINEEHLCDEDWRKVWRYVDKTIRTKRVRPSEGVVRSRFPWVRFENVEPTDLTLIIEGLQERLDYNKLLKGLQETVRAIENPGDVKAGVERLQSTIRNLNGHDHGNGITDPFSKMGIKATLFDQQNKPGIKTGFAAIDAATGGMKPGRVWVVAGRISCGKSFVAIKSTASALMAGKSVLFYSLEMSQPEVSARLYSILARDMLDQTVSPFAISKKDWPIIREVKKGLRDRGGKLHLFDPTGKCTLGRVEADVEALRPDVCWIDYITLMRMPRASSSADRATVIGDLSGGLKRISLGFDVAMGYCAQLNREATKSSNGIGLEHIAKSDQIGADADTVVAIAREGDKSWLELPKNRHGPPILNSIVLDFFPDSGIIREAGLLVNDADEKIHKPLGSVKKPKVPTS